ncbi:MAG: NrdJb, partial [Rickettsiales bacterium]|nr:NrdJb [Rickettsiales bacterium]
MKKIDKKIVSYTAKSIDMSNENTDKLNITIEDHGKERAEVIRMHEKLERPEMLIGSTYK